MSDKQIWLYDTTLRDGAQREGISLSLTDKIKIVQKLDENKRINFNQADNDHRTPFYAACQFNQTNQIHIGNNYEINHYFIVANQPVASFYFHLKSNLNYILYHNIK